jgi:hypothetical protein
MPYDRYPDPPRSRISPSTDETRPRVADQGDRGGNRESCDHQSQGSVDGHTAPAAGREPDRLQQVDLIHDDPCGHRRPPWPVFHEEHDRLYDEVEQ